MQSLRSEKRSFSEIYCDLGTLGQGGFGYVLKVRKLDSDKVVALKQIKIPGTTREERIEKMRICLREYENWYHIAKQNHDCAIVKLYDVFYTGDFTKLYIEMEYIAGGDLITYIENHSYNSANDEKRIFEIDEVVDRSISLLAAIDTTHQSKILHRDIKPDNILFDQENDQFVLTDLGLSCYSSECDFDSPFTPSYRDPRTIECNIQDVFSDIYALGVTLYELLTGDLFEPGKNYQQVYLNCVRRLQAIQNDYYDDENNPSYIFIDAVCLMLTPFDIENRPSLSSVIESVTEGKLDLLYHSPERNFGRRYDKKCNFV